MPHRAALCSVIIFPILAVRIRSDHPRGTPAVDPAGPRARRFYAVLHAGARYQASTDASAQSARRTVLFESVRFADRRARRYLRRVWFGKEFLHELFDLF